MGLISFIFRLFVLAFSHLCLCSILWLFVIVLFSVVCQHLWKYDSAGLTGKLHAVCSTQRTQRQSWGLLLLKACLWTSHCVPDLMCSRPNVPQLDMSASYCATGPMCSWPDVSPSQCVRGPMCPQPSVFPAQCVPHPMCPESMGSRRDVFQARCLLIPPTVA